MELHNGAPPRDGVETVTINTTGILEHETPVKVSGLHMHRLRNLAIASIICGCSCTGVLALIYAVKVSDVCLSWESGREACGLRWLLVPMSFLPNNGKCGATFGSRTIDSSAEVRG